MAEGKDSEQLMSGSISPFTSLDEYWSALETKGRLSPSRSPPASRDPKVAVKDQTTSSLRSSPPTKSLSILPMFGFPASTSPPPEKATNSTALNLTLPPLVSNESPQPLSEYEGHSLPDKDTPLPDANLKVQSLSSNLSQLPLAESAERSPGLEKSTTSIDPNIILQSLASNESLLPVLELEEHPPAPEKFTPPTARSNDAVAQPHLAVASNHIPESLATASKRPQPPRANKIPRPDHPGNVPSPIGSDQHEEEPFVDPDVHRILCMRVYFACVSVIGVLMIPVGLIILAYLASGSDVPREIPVPTAPPRRTPRGVKGDPWSGVSPRCIGNRNVTDRFGLNDTFINNTNIMSPIQYPFFCMYNNSRAFKNTTYDYLPIHIPFGLCPNVVYWSMGIVDGVVKSRMPQFDKTYGIEQLRNVTTTQGYHDIKLLMALGGYPEDGQHFSRLGRDPVSMSTLVSSVLVHMLQYKLDGVLIHWIRAEGNCSQPDDTTTLSTLLDTLRDIFHVNGLNMTLSVILQANKTLLDELIPIVGRKLDFIFITTHLELPKPSMNMCLDAQSFVLNNLTSIVGYHAHQHKLCISSSMTGRALNVPFDRSLRFSGQSEYFAATNLSQVNGRLALFEICALGAQDPGLNPNSLFCLFRETVYFTTPRTRQLYVFDLPIISHRILHDGFVSSMDRPCRCALLYDIDLDNFNSICSLRNAQGGRYIRLSDFYTAVTNPSSISKLGP